MLDVRDAFDLRRQEIPHPVDQDATGRAREFDVVCDRATERLSNGLPDYLQRQGIAVVAFDERLPDDVVAIQLLVAQERAAVVDPEPGQVDDAHWTARPSKHRELRRLLTAGDENAALVWRFGNLAKQYTIPLVPRAIAADATTWLEHGFDVVQHEQAPLVAQQFEQASDQSRFSPGGGRIGRREESQHVGEPFGWRRRVPQAAPDDALE